jgi:hypothetical protein
VIIFEDNAENDQITYWIVNVNNSKQILFESNILFI